MFYVIAWPAGGDTPAFAVGYELLRRFAVKVDYDNQRLTLYDAPRFHYSGPGTAVPLRLQGTTLLAEASIDNVSGSFGLDTGNEFGFSLASDFTNKNDLVHKLGAHYLAYNGRGYAGPGPEAYLVRIHDLHIGKVPAPSVIAHLTTDPSDKNDVAGNIGQSILGKFTEVFDCMRGQLYFEKTKESEQTEVFNRAGLVFDSFGHGLQVMTVLPGSPGAKAGLRAGDVITAIDGKVPTDDVNQPAFVEGAGTVLHLTVQHGSESRDVSVMLRDVL